MAAEVENPGKTDILKHPYRAFIACSSMHVISKTANMIVLNKMAVVLQDAYHPATAILPD
ncbi:hypothetical protein [Butyrivibrio sp. AE2032]|jgi:hypothetical protein|uniref:hypothetical protein n=1 Tax=Butyrivibrio sp. AE2032 TaxID=1458463 RepID=UPI000B32038E|nr:hypothetical protein [Butyrivibrio sp. AE2032]